MSKLTDYSKFDNIGDSSDEDENDNITSSDTATNATSATSSNNKPAAPHPPPPSIQGITKKHPSISDRYIFTYNNQTIYEWEQSLDEVTIYISAPLSQLPKTNTASYINVNISTNKLQVGLKSQPDGEYFINETTFGKVKVNESSWYLDEEGIITIILCKVFRGETWEGVLRGHAASTTDANNSTIDGGGIHETIDPITKHSMQRTLMLERFQEENPGFDFRDATFNGEVPDPRKFLGGVSYNN